MVLHAVFDPGREHAATIGTIIRQRQRFCETVLRP